jgi:hypothetical protein
MGNVPHHSDLPCGTKAVSLSARIAWDEKVRRPSLSSKCASLSGKSELFEGDTNAG